MSERIYVGYFEDEHAVVRATATARRKGYHVVDVFCPYPVHGLSEAMGLGPSRLYWIGVVAGILGLTLGLTLQFWTSVYDWPLNIGGHPFGAWPVFIPVSFELTVLLSGVIGVFALLTRSRLWPGNPTYAQRRVTDDRFALVLSQRDAALEGSEIAMLLRENGAVEIVEGDEVP
jgi:hypothetical protein